MVYDFAPKNTQNDAYLYKKDPTVFWDPKRYQIFDFYPWKIRRASPPFDIREVMYLMQTHPWARTRRT